MAHIADLSAKFGRLTKAIVKDGAIQILKDRSHKRPVQIIDAAWNDAEDYENGEAASELLPRTKLWPEPVDGAGLLGELVKTQQRFLVADESIFRLVALWSVFTHCFDCFDCLPLLFVTAPTKQAGKSTRLTLVKAFSRRAFLVSSITAAVVYRIGETYQPTLLIDEADACMRDNEGLRGVIDGGHTRSTALVPRCDGPDNEVRFFLTFYPKAIAAIGRLADTIEQRSVIARLRRASGSEYRGLEYLTLAKLEALSLLRAKAARWAHDKAERLRNTEPQIPAEMTNGRMIDNFRPLFAIADVAGGEWLLD